MKASDFQLFAKMVHDRSGIFLAEDKAYLVESRLMPVARKHNLETLEALADKIRSGGTQEGLSYEITEALTTNESSFFRDQRPFDQFQNYILPRLMETRRDRRLIRIWSAACSSGQEPYSLAILLKEMEAKLQGWKIEIVASDISQAMVNKARNGEYTQFEVQRGLPISLLVKYFNQNGDKWILKDEIRQKVTFKEFNLLQDPANLGIFDVIFCRNVLIYFDAETKSTVLQRLSRRMPPDGILLLGGAETVLGVTDRFKPIDGQRGLYQVLYNGPPGSTVLVNQSAQAMA